MIRYLRNSEIDKNSWDECIENAENGIIYANSWYLDIVSPNWDALVMDNYTTVMPLPRLSKFGIHYIFTPKFTQQLGVIGKEISQKIIDIFILSIPQKFRLVNLNMNEHDTIPGGDFTIQKRQNFKLQIDRPYEKILDGYNRNCKRNLLSAEKSKCMISENIGVEEFSKFIKQNVTGQLDKVSAKDFILLQNITTECLKRKRAEIISIRDEIGTLLAAGSFLYSKDRLIFSVCASSPVGKKNHAMYMLVDHQIRKYAGKFAWYDFSGSNIKGVAYFNSTFGAQSAFYHTLIVNRLPLIIKLITGRK